MSFLSLLVAAIAWSSPPPPAADTALHHRIDELTTRVERLEALAADVFVGPIGDVATKWSDGGVIAPATSPVTLVDLEVIASPAGVTITGWLDGPRRPLHYLVEGDASGWRSRYVVSLLGVQNLLQDRIVPLAGGAADHLEVFSDGAALFVVINSHQAMSVAFDYTDDHFTLTVQ